MKLLRKLNMRKAKNSKRSERWGMFACPFCNCEKERRIASGKRDQSCGCAQYTLISKAHIIHGDSKPDSEYYGFWFVWLNMKNRYYDPKYIGYKNYGGRGITVYKNWRFDYPSFKEWMLSLERGWTKGLTIDRIDNDGNYEPTNCRFVTQAVNIRKQKRFKLSMPEAREIRKKWKSGNYTQKALAVEYKICQQNISCIISNKTWKEGQE